MTTGAANTADHATAGGSRGAPQTRETLASLKTRYPWPTERPSESPILWSLDYGGRRLITDAITSRGVNVLLEIGSFLGGSALQWLAASREVVVVCVDPWPDLIDPGPGITAHHIGRAYRDQLRAPEGVYRSFISSMWRQTRLSPNRACWIARYFSRACSSRDSGSSVRACPSVNRR